jgi:AcrR family transcriptional regulator
LTLEASSSNRPNRSIANGFVRLKPGPKRSDIDVGKHQRTRLQRAMTQLVAQGGYRSVTVRKLTRLAGVSTSTFYSQFDGTDDCFLTTYGALMERAWRRLAAARASDCDRREQAVRSLRALLGSFASDPGAARVALVEVFDGGPAALAPVRAHETRLEVALRESLDRRGHRISPTAAAWITAGVLHLSRAQIGSGRDDGLEQVEAIVHWGREFVAAADPPPIDGARHGRPLPTASSQRPKPASVPPVDETELILAAATKLAAADGYWRLSEARISKAAGVPRTHFKRHFADLEEVYLAAVRRVSRRLFRHLASTDCRPGRPWQDALHQGIVSVVEEAAATPATARLALSGILEPGLGGLTTRESLVGEIAAAWVATVPAAQRPRPLAAEAAVASLWDALAHMIEAAEADRTPATAALFAHLFLVSVGRSPGDAYDETRRRVAPAGV